MQQVKISHQQTKPPPYNLGSGFVLPSFIRADKSEKPVINKKSRLFFSFQVLFAIINIGGKREVFNMDEFSFISLIKQDTYKQPSLIKGIGDDAAVFRQSSQDIVTAVDTFVENVHFSRTTMTPFQIGFRSLAANVSDLAAMGAVPAFYLVSIVIPSSWMEEELHQIFLGMESMGTPHKMDLIGGDTVSGSELSISVTVIGYISRDKARYRNAAKTGDVVFVTGTLGDSQAGYHMLTNPGDYMDEAYFHNKHQMPLPRVSFAEKLSNLNRVALNDISDGMANEADEIAAASNVSISIYENKLPIRSSIQQFPLSLQHKWKLFGGEDFELMGTIAPSEWDELIKIAQKTETPLTEIGYVGQEQRKSHNVYLIDRNNQRVPLGKKGYTHWDR